MTQGVQGDEFADHGVEFGVEVEALDHADLLRRRIVARWPRGGEGRGAGLLAPGGRGHAGEVIAEGLGGDAEQFGGAQGHGVALDGAGDFAEDFADGVHGAHHAGLAVEVLALTRDADEEVDQRHGLAQAGAEGVGALLENVAVGVLALGQGGDADGEAGLVEDVGGADGGGFAGGVGVEHQHDLVGQTAKQAGVVGGDGSALGGDGVEHAGGVAADDVDLAFA